MKKFNCDDCKNSKSCDKSHCYLVDEIRGKIVEEFIKGKLNFSKFMKRFKK